MLIRLAKRLLLRLAKWPGSMRAAGMPGPKDLGFENSVYELEAASPTL